MATLRMPSCSPAISAHSPMSALTSTCQDVGWHPRLTSTGFCSERRLIGSNTMGLRIRFSSLQGPGASNGVSSWQDSHRHPYARRGSTTADHRLTTHCVPRGVMPENLRDCTKRCASMAVRTLSPCSSEGQLCSSGGGPDGTAPDGVTIQHMLNRDSGAKPPAESRASSSGVGHQK